MLGCINVRSDITLSTTPIMQHAHSHHNSKHTVWSFSPWTKVPTRTDSSYGYRRSRYRSGQSIRCVKMIYVNLEVLLASFFTLPTMFWTLLKTPPDVGSAFFNIAFIDALRVDKNPSNSLLRSFTNADGAFLR